MIKLSNLNFENNINNENIILQNKDGVEYLQFKKLLEHGIKHAYTLKPQRYCMNTKITSKELIQESYNNYKKMCEILEIDVNKFYAPQQNHTNNIQILNEEYIKNGSIFMEDSLENIDGLITNKKEVSLATINADCILLMFYDPVKNVIANVHSGWRGTTQKISVKAIEKMAKNFGCNPADIICCICPSIRKCHFEVEKEVKEIFVKEFGYTGKTDMFLEYVGKKDGIDKWHIDTVLINKIILIEAGLQEKNIIDSGLCSVCNNQYIFSNRVDVDKFGRNTAIISLKREF